MPDSYDVVRAADRALVVRDIDLDTAREERARLNAEARLPHPTLRDTRNNPVATGMFLGELVTYEIRSKTGLVVR